MSRESVEDKALRYIAEDRINVVRVDPHTGEADVAARGSGPEPYRVMLRAGAWSCDCPAQIRCAHQVASGLVVRPEAHAPAFGTGDLDAVFAPEPVGDEDPFKGLV